MGTSVEYTSQSSDIKDIQDRFSWYEQEGVDGETNQKAIEILSSNKIENYLKEDLYFIWDIVLKLFGKDALNKIDNDFVLGINTYRRLYIEHDNISNNDSQLILGGAKNDLKMNLLNITGENTYYEKEKIFFEKLDHKIIEAILMKKIHTFPDNILKKMIHDDNLGRKYA